MGECGEVKQEDGQAGRLAGQAGRQAAGGRAAGQAGRLLRGWAYRDVSGCLCWALLCTGTGKQQVALHSPGAGVLIRIEEERVEVVLPQRLQLPVVEQVRKAGLCRATQAGGQGRQAGGQEAGGQAGRKAGGQNGRQAGQQSGTKPRVRQPATEGKGLPYTAHSSLQLLNRPCQTPHLG